MGQSQRENLSILPYIDFVPEDGRCVPIGSYWHSNLSRWEVWFAQDHLIAPFAGGKPVSGIYFSASVASSSTDLISELGTLVFRHLSFPEIWKAYSRIVHYVIRFGSIMAHLDVLEAHTKNDNNTTSNSQLATSLLEHLISVTRSFYDLLQRLIKEVLKLVRIKLFDGSFGDNLYNSQPKNFTEIVQKRSSSDLRTAKEIEVELGISTELAEFYAKSSLRFQWLKTLRNRIEHDGDKVGYIFVLEEGFGVDLTLSPWNELNIWDSQIRKRNMVSLRAVFAEIIKESLNQMDRLSDALKGIAEFPTALSSNTDVFIRDVHMVRLVMIDYVIQNPWEAFSYPLIRSDEQTLEIGGSAFIAAV
jgi:uncharacterized protein YozE (UPF0346 family)